MLKTVSVFSSGLLYVTVPPTAPSGIEISELDWYFKFPDIKVEELSANLKLSATIYASLLIWPFIVKSLQAILTSLAIIELVSITNFEAHP